MIVLWIAFSTLLIGVDVQYSLYNSDIHLHDHPTFDCLYAQTVESKMSIDQAPIFNEYVIPFCRRLDSEEISDVVDGSIVRAIPFDELNQLGITGEQLLSWSAPIDVVERYEMSASSTETYYNCSSPWFGMRCQYRFINDVILSFDEIVRVFQSSRARIRLNMTDISTITCYPFLVDCQRGPWSLCLDWREICDGKADCISGEDESACEQLELTSCSDDEYRCHYGGQCIPVAFARDGQHSVDCLDGTDEVVALSDDPYDTLPYRGCTETFAFRCHDATSPYRQTFACGDGELSSSDFIPTISFSCTNQRDHQMTVTMLSSFAHVHNATCRRAFRCALLSNRSYGRSPSGDIFQSYMYFPGPWNETCPPLADNCEEEWLVLPEKPIMYGYFELVYFTNRSVEAFRVNIEPDLICFHAQNCRSSLCTTEPVNIIDGLVCCRSSDLLRESPTEHFHTLYQHFKQLYDRCSRASDDLSCANTSYFHCPQSLKCIPYARVGDGHQDCLYGEDERAPTCHRNDSSRFVCETHPSGCVSLVALKKQDPLCPTAGNEPLMSKFNYDSKILFPALCNGDFHQYFAFVDGQIETDEDHCEWWPCSALNLMCDGIWNCMNGVDELSCALTLCPSNDFPCRNDALNLTHCLPFGHMYHKTIEDCSNDEFLITAYYSNRTNVNSDKYRAFNTSTCLSGTDVCYNRSEPLSVGDEGCPKFSQKPVSASSGSDVLVIDGGSDPLCSITHRDLIGQRSRPLFLITTHLGSLPALSPSASNSEPNAAIHAQRTTLPKLDPALAWYCYYGILVLSGINQTRRCLCPPNYFGSRCQWQNQRVSLTLQLRVETIALSMTVFQLIVMLVDEHGVIAPNHEHFFYTAARECDTKRSVYLLYPQRPKSTSANYSIRMDLYDQATLTFWASWHVPIPFSFLPVNRIAKLLTIPAKPQGWLSTLPCGEHNPFCNSTLECHCANDSLCLAPFICLCPRDKFGPRCYLKRTVCNSTHNPCLNNGTCLPTDPRLGPHKFTCLCQDGYFGDRCEQMGNIVHVAIDKSVLAKTSSLMIHYITAFDGLARHEQTTALKKIPFAHDTITLRPSQPFHMLFAQLAIDELYLVVLRERYLLGESIHAYIRPEQRCARALDHLHTDIHRRVYLRRLKSYPSICTRRPQLMCFYDDYNMCICDSNRFSNCFLFNRTVIDHYCRGTNPCQHGGRCFPNNATCPSSFLCACGDCYYGDRCQMSTEAYIFSLDAILGYHIKPHVAISQQPLIIKLSMVITVVLCVVGFVFGSLSVVTFRLKQPREVGCGYYLLTSSIISVSMSIMLGIKFGQLLLSQMSAITNRSALSAACFSIELILKTLLTSSEWLHACVSVERMFTVVQGVKFRKSSSIRTAKRVIIGTLVVALLTHLHDPIHRRLIDDLDGDQRRTWCFTDMSSSVTRYNGFITLFHFLTPFSINVVAAVFLILLVARLQSKVELRQSLKQHVRLQLRQHRHLIVTPCLLIALGLPRLIISFTTGCMKSAREPWLYMIGYFISFAPTMSTFFVFVLPSKKYLAELKRSLKRYSLALFSRELFFA